MLQQDWKIVLLRMLSSKEEVSLAELRRALACGRRLSIAEVEDAIVRKHITGVFIKQGSGNPIFYRGININNKNREVSEITTRRKRFC